MLNMREIYPALNKHSRNWGKLRETDKNNFKGSARSKSADQTHTNHTSPKDPPVKDPATVSGLTNQNSRDRATPAHQPILEGQGASTQPGNISRAEVPPPPAEPPERDKET